MLLSSLTALAVPSLTPTAVEEPMLLAPAKVVDPCWALAVATELFSASAVAELKLLASASAAEPPTAMDDASEVFKELALAAEPSSAKAVEMLVSSLTALAVPLLTPTAVEEPVLLAPANVVEWSWALAVATELFSASAVAEL